MSNRIMKVMGWFVLLLAAATAVLSFAPFTPSVILVALYLPFAAYLARHSAHGVAFAILAFCGIALVVSPISASNYATIAISSAVFSVSAVAIIYFVIKHRQLSSDDKTHQPR